MVALLQTSECPSQNTLHARGQLRNRSELGSIRSKPRQYAALRGSFYGEGAQLGSCSRDPIGFEGGIHIFSYTSGSPLSHLDPSGTDWTTSDFTGHYTNGHGRPIDLDKDAGLLDEFRQMHSVTIKAFGSSSLNTGRNHIRCDKPGFFSWSGKSKSVPVQWSSVQFGPLYSLGWSTVNYSSEITVSWTCEDCCDGNPIKLTSWKIDVFGQFELLDAFTNPNPFRLGPDNSVIAKARGDCTYACYKKLVQGKLDDREHSECVKQCRKQFKTRGDDGIIFFGYPYGITAQWQERWEDNGTAPCTN